MSTSFKDLISAFGTYTKPDHKHDNIYGVIHKFTTGGTKYRIRKEDEGSTFLVEFVPSGSRLYRRDRTFSTLLDAENYIFTAEASQ